MWVAGIADGARVIVQGQDFVREGQTGRAGRRRRSADRQPRAALKSDAMSKLIDYAISHARLTIATLLFLLVRGLRRLCDDPEGGGARRQDPDHLRPAHPARHQPGGCRAAAAAAGRDAAQVGRQRQGDALDRLRGRRLRAARVRGRLRFQGGAGRRARQGRPRQARSAARRRRAAGARRSISRSIRCWWWRCPATCRSARCCASPAPPRTRSSRCPACWRRSCAARATRRSRSSSSRC